MNLLQIRPVDKPSPAKKQIQPSSGVELVRVSWQDHQVRIVFREAGGEEKTFGGDVSLLESFQQFRKYCFMLFGIWARHISEDAVTDREASRLWNDDVQAAVLAGRGE